MSYEYILPEGIDDYIDLPYQKFNPPDEFIPTEVFHYTSMKVALEKILGERKLLIGNLVR